MCQSALHVNADLPAACLIIINPWIQQQYGDSLKNHGLVVFIRRAVVFAIGLPVRQGVLDEHAHLREQL